MLAGVIDYGAGNLRSVGNTLDSLGVEQRRIGSAAAFEAASAEVDTLIFPGVGAFGDCSRNLDERGLMEPLRKWIAADRPFLGICIGFQMLFESSTESPDARGIGALPGRVVRFPEAEGLKVPHMGWNAARTVDPSDPAWTGLGADPHFYFVHSYFPEPADQSLVASTTLHGVEFASSIRRGNLFATQFHPEKSQSAGARFIGNVLGLEAR